MLVLSLHPKNHVWFRDRITGTQFKMFPTMLMNGRAKLGFEAPTTLQIVRSETGYDAPYPPELPGQILNIVIDGKFPTTPALCLAELEEPDDDAEQQLLLVTSDGRFHVERLKNCLFVTSDFSNPQLQSIKQRYGF